MTPCSAICTAPVDEVVQCERRYQADTLVLENCLVTATGELTITAAMPPSGKSRLIRKVSCARGSLAVQIQCTPRFGYGRSRPQLATSCYERARKSISVLKRRWTSGVDSEVDASLLMIPLVNFLPASDPRMQATLAVIEETLLEDGLVRRYRVSDQANIEGTFLACSFWLVDNYWLSGRRDDAVALFERLSGLRNDVGLQGEEDDANHRRRLGNFPQGRSHLTLVSSARLMSSGDAREVFLE